MFGGRTLSLPAVFLPDSADVIRGERGRTVRRKGIEVTAVLPWMVGDVDTVRVEKGRETAHEGLEWDWHRDAVRNAHCATEFERMRRPAVNGWASDGGAVSEGELMAAVGADGCS